MATACYQLQEAIIQGDVWSANPRRAAVIAEAEARDALADQLAQLALADGELVAYRDRLAALYQQSGELGLQETEFMSEEGTVSSLNGDLAVYEDISAQHRAVKNEIETQRSSLRIHCSLQ